MAKHESRTAKRVGLEDSEQILQAMDGIQSQGVGHSRRLQAVALAELARLEAMSVLCAWLLSI